MRRFLVIFNLLIFIATLFFKTHALENPGFSTEYDITYTVSETGETEVSYNVVITNQSDDVIATSYALTINQVSVYDESGIEGKNPTSVKKTIEKDNTTLKIFFNESALGKGVQKKFTIKYKTLDVASRVGRIWNINVPKSHITENTTLYNVKLEVPKNLGPKIFVSPNPAIEKEESGSTIYYFTKENLTKKGITASFGEYQILNFKLGYQLENPSFFSRIYEIALPPDIKELQQVSYSIIKPWPQKLYVDKDGNTIARYKIAAKKKLEIETIGSAKILARQINPVFGGNIKNIPRGIALTYTKSQKFWETHSKPVITLEKQLYDKNLNTSENAYKIYNFLVENLSYDIESSKKIFVERKGAYNTLTNSSSVACMEFTDTFIALARAMGIPAREINGYAFNNSDKNTPVSINLKSGDTLHAWAEYYDPKFGWVQIDPTWGNTSKGIDYFSKLDTNHFAFVIKGKSSEYPLPAGMYRTDENEKLIQVDFSQNVNSNLNFQEKLVLHKKFNFNPIQILFGRKKYSLENEGKVFVYIFGKPLAPSQSRTIYLPRNSTNVTYETFEGSEIERDLINTN